MALQKSMLVARADLKMAMKVSMVKYGLILIAAFGPVMLIATVLLIALTAPTVAAATLAMIDPLLSPMVGIIAIIPASLISANALVGEREQNTLEPLLCTPLTDRELLLGKLLSSFIPSIALLLGSILITEVSTIFILVSVGSEIVLVPGLSSLFLLLTTGPTLILAMVSVMILISGRVKRVYEAYQTSGATVMLFIIPMLLPMISMDTSGNVDMNLVWFSNFITLLIAILLAIVTWALAIGRFNRDKMVSM
ncbi:MAG: ABC transporter permease subunit [Candidatus Thorarchaeota archaeon]|nr:ABC transporter permease subunit [Candidatus Thorarchaeota archaeon]